jgi:hypothetical protein
MIFIFRNKLLLKILVLLKIFGKYCSYCCQKAAVPSRVECVGFGGKTVMRPQRMAAACLIS